MIPYGWRFCVLVLLLIHSVTEVPAQEPTFRGVPWYVSKVEAASMLNAAGLGHPIEDEFGDLIYPEESQNIRATFVDGVLMRIVVTRPLDIDGPQLYALYTVADSLTQLFGQPVVGDYGTHTWEMSSGRISTWTREADNGGDVVLVVRYDAPGADAAILGRIAARWERERRAWWRERGRSEERWDIVLEEDSTIVAFDNSRISRPQGGNLIVWHVWDFRADRYSSAADRDYNSAMQRVEVDCTALRYRIHQTVFYHGRENVYSDNRLGVWSDAIPESLGEAVYRRTCSALGF